MKLELKHLKGYIDHELKCIPIGNHTNLKKGAVEVIGIMAKSGYGDDPIIITKDYDNEYYLKDFQLLLRPLSYLTKEIVIDGEKFVPVDLLYENWQNNKGMEIWWYKTEMFLAAGHYRLVEYGTIQKLYEWHFDIHGLIKKGLAIDINSLK